jgi:heme-degrading monooxygenase HmoA
MNRPVELHADLSVDPAHEAELVRYFEAVYRPAAKKFAGYIDLKLLRLHSVLLGEAPANLTYRFVITYETEALRQKWVQSEIHQEVWGTIEKMFASTDYDFLLFEVI